MAMRTKLTQTARARLEEVASLKARVPSTRQLASETGLTPLYLRQVLAKMIKTKRSQLKLTVVT